MNGFTYILSAFGLQAIKPKLYPPEYSMVPIFETLTGDEPKFSLLGTPVFTNIVIKSKDKKLKLRIDTVLADISMSKNIIKTAIQGRNGTVKEYISDGDYDITLRGMLTSQNASQYPLEEFNRLLKLCELNEALTIVSDYIQLFGIYDIVIDSSSFPQREGFQNTQLFELKCVSDKPIELIENV